MKWPSVLSISALMIGSSLAAFAQAPPFAINAVTFDENGKGTFQQNNDLSTPLTFNAGTDNVLTYQLAFAVTPGDVLLNDNPTGASTGIGDVIRFTANNSVQFYSDSGPNDTPDNLADFSVFPTRDTFSPNAVTLPEMGAEGNNGAFYIPKPGDPGFNPGVTLTTYGIISDSPIPEAASSVSLGLLLALGLGGFIAARKCKTA